MKIAQFRDTVLAYTSIRTQDTVKWRTESEVQISEWVDVEFVPIPTAVDAATAAEVARDEAKHILKQYYDSLKTCDNKVA